MKKGQLKALFIEAKGTGQKYIGVMIQTEGSSEPEVIINPKENFNAKASGGGASQTVPINSNVKLETAKGFNKSLAGTYKVTGAGALNLRSGAGTGKDKKVLTTMQSGETCQCYGYYTDVSGVKWLYVAYKNVVGFASSKYLKK